MNLVISIAPYWDKFSRFVHEKTLRERVIILLVIVVVVYGVAEILFLGAHLDKRERQIKQLNSLVESNETAQQEVQALLDQMKESRLVMQRQQELLNEKLNRVDQQLASAASGFIPATLMPKVLEQLLDSSAGLILIKLENKPVVQVTDLDADLSNASGINEARGSDTGNNEQRESEPADLMANSSLDSQATVLYRHGVELQLQGSYLATLAYLKQLESLEWRFEWDALLFDIQDYPVGMVTLEVYTYSTERDWIGV